MQPESYAGDTYPIENTQLSLSVPRHSQPMQDTYPSNPDTISPGPWNSERALNNQGMGFDYTALGPTGGISYNALGLPENNLDLGQEVLGARVPGAFEPVPASQDTEGEDKDWQIVPSNASSPWASQNSSQSGSPAWCKIKPFPPSSSPKGSYDGTNSHASSVSTALSNPKRRGARNRTLTPQEKQEAMDVRKAKACWACHLSKIKVPLIQIAESADELLTGAVFPMFLRFSLPAVRQVEWQEKILPSALLQRPTRIAPDIPGTRYEMIRLCLN